MEIKHQNLDGGLVTVILKNTQTNKKEEHPMEQLLSLYNIRGQIVCSLIAN